jgi:hypothetical protein
MSFFCTVGLSPVTSYFAVSPGLASSKADYAFQLLSHTRQNYRSRQIGDMPEII